MNSPSPVATASASGGIVGSIVMLLCWIMTFFGIAVPGEVVAAMMVLVTPIVHIITLRFGFDPSDPTPISQQPQIGEASPLPPAGHVP